MMSKGIFTCHVSLSFVGKIQFQSYYKFCKFFGFWRFSPASDRVFAGENQIIL